MLSPTLNVDIQEFMDQRRQHNNKYQNGFSEIVDEEKYIGIKINDVPKFRK